MRNYFLLLSLVLFSFCYEVKAQCYDKGSIVISEIYFDTRFGENISTKYHHLGEYIELYNSSNVAIDLQGWIIKDNHTEFTIGPIQTNSPYSLNTIIQPGGIKIITFSNFYANDHDSWYHTGNVNTGLESPMGAVNKFIDLFPQAAGHEEDIILQNRMVLYNLTDKVSLYNPSGRLVHEVSYNNGAPRVPALEYMNINDFSIDFDLIDTHISNGDGGVFNGAIGLINVLDGSGNPTYYDEPVNEQPILFQSNLYQTSIYLSDEFAYYFDKPKTLLIGQATPFTLPYSIPLLDVHPDLLSPPSGGFNYVHSIVYDINSPTSQKLAESRSYFDDFAKPTVSMSYNYFENNTWATETTYDSFGRPLQTSFPAIVCNDDFKKIDVLSNSQMKADFLDSYYSNANTHNTYQATATQPYTEVEYDKLNPGNVIKSFGGNQIAGEWKSGYSYTVPAAQEMYYLFGHNFFNGSVDSFGKEEIITKFYKTVSVDANGVENVAFSDGEGKTLAVARSGLTTPATINPYPVHSLIGTQGYVDVCIPPGITSGITLIGGAGNYDVYNLRQNTGIPTTAALTGGNCYRIVAKVIPTVDPKVFVTQSTGVLSYSTTDPAGVKGISYNVNYYDYSFNIYDTTGRLKKSVQPNGFRSVYAATPATFTITAAPSYIPDTFTNFSTSYKYNTLGQLIEVNSKDEGLSKFAYRNDGQIRYSQSALQASSTEIKVSYTNYDNLSRPIESGVLKGATPYTTASIWSAAIAGVDNNTLVPTTANITPSERTFTIYDYVDNSVGLTVTIPSSLSLTTLQPVGSNYATSQHNLSGNVAVTYKADTGSTITNITWYSYDIYGRVEWLVKYDSVLGGVKTIDYVYDKDGNVKQVIFQKNLNTEKFTHQYTYDANSRLIKVETAAGTNPFTEDAQYNYNISGQLSRVRIGEIVQGIDYVYTLGGALKSINHPSLETTKDPGKDGLTGTPNASVTPDLFGITLDYFQGDYNRAGTNIVTSPNITPNYSGNIMGSRWATKPMDGPSPPSTTTAQQKGYLYNYNRNNWLKDAKYGTTDNSGLITIPTPVSPLLEKHSEQDLQYDSNGNITKLKRTNGSGTIVDDLTYDYTYAGTNRLNRVRDFVPNSPASLPDYDNDINPLQNSGNYVYNVLGQLISNIQEKTHYVYNTQGLVSEIRQGGTTYATSTNVYKFYYNELGHRIRKEVYTATTTLQNTTYYVLDASGNAMAIYYRAGTGGTIAQTELPIYGASRLGVYMKSSNAKNYQITDHLGNVRAVAQRAVGSNIVTTLSYADYYPFGEQLQGRSSASNYRYAYQGQELDTETGMEAFQLRMWDGRLGRWLSPDPYGQYASPYLGMGNNPINLIDPDGGWASGGGGDDEYCSDCAQSYNLSEFVIYPMMDKYSFSDWTFRRHLEKNNEYYFKRVVELEKRGIYNRLQTVKKDYWGGFSGQFANGGSTGSKYDVFAGFLAIGVAPVAVGYAAPTLPALIEVPASKSVFFSKAGLDLTTEILGNKGALGDINVISVIASGFGADALSSPFKLTYNEGLKINSFEQTVVNYGVNKVNASIHGGVENLTSGPIFNSGFGKTYGYSFSIGTQSFIKNLTSD